jgi:hypothetical protein
MKQLSLFRVTVAGAGSSAVPARTAGAAARKAFRRLIADKAMQRQPPTSPEGGFKGVSIEVRPPKVRAVPLIRPQGRSEFAAMFNSQR